MGWVLSDANGEVLWLEMRSVPRLTTTLAVEALSLWWAMKSLADFRF